MLGKAAARRPGGNSWPRRETEQIGQGAVNRPRPCLPVVSAIDDAQLDQLGLLLEHPLVEQRRLERAALGDQGVVGL